MSKKYIEFILLLITFVFTGCFGLLDSGSDKIIGRYIVVWIDLPANQTISEQSELNSGNSSQVVPEYVYAVGHNADYIIAKQHPTSGFKSGYEVNTKITNYYIVDVHRNELKKGDNVFGPLTLNQFDSLRAVFEIKNINFDLNYPDNP